MGCHCGYSLCSICGNEALTEDDFCEHILNYKGTTYNGLPVWEENCDVSFFEDSFVTVGADRNAKILEKVASKQTLPKRGVISKVSHHEHNVLRDEQNQRTFKGRVDSFMNKLNDLPWS
jgi:flagellar basal body rod protein FlgF